MQSMKPPIAKGSSGVLNSVQNNLAQKVPTRGSKNKQKLQA